MWHSLLLTSVYGTSVAINEVCSKATSHGEVRRTPCSFPLIPFLFLFLYLYLFPSLSSRKTHASQKYMRKHARGAGIDNPTDNDTDT